MCRCLASKCSLCNTHRPDAYFSSPIALAQDSSAAEPASPYSKIFGLFVGQSPDAVEEYLQNEFGIPAENYKSYTVSGAEPDAAQAVIEVPATTISILFDSVRSIGLADWAAASKL